MGYSSRYHTASLAAVFVALAVGIVIGAALGSDVVSGTAENLEQDLGEDLDRVRAENSDLEARLEEAVAVQEQLYPVVVGGRLRRVQVALVGFGGVDAREFADLAERALTPSGATLTEVAVVREPPDVPGLVESLLGESARAVPRGQALSLAARRAGRLLVGAGDGLGDARGPLLTSFSGDPRGIDAVVLVRSAPEELEDRQAADTDRLEAGLLEGFGDAGVRVVGAERAEDEPSQIEFFARNGLSTVDNVEDVAGRVALVLALAGAEGSFGTKEGADSLLPELLGAASAGEGQSTLP